MVVGKQAMQAASSSSEPSAAASTEPPALFQKLASKMTPTIRRLLVDGENAASIAPGDLLRELGINLQRHLLSGADNAKVVCAPSALDPNACAELQGAVDQSRSSKRDSVDGAPEHQLPLRLDQLASLIGEEQAKALVRLPTTHFGLPAQAPSDIFVRRYTGGTRPWNPFHHDAAAVTVNVALCADGSFTGGKLIAVCNGEVKVLDRAKGEATVHDSRLLHAVTRITAGVRYSLILVRPHAEPRPSIAVLR